MTVRVSYDDGNNWPVHQLINEGPSAYSCLARITNGNIGLLYEKEKDIVFASMTIEDIEG